MTIAASPSMVRDSVACAKRIVVKVGSNALTNRRGGLDSNRIDALVDAVAARAREGVRIVLVSSGAIAAGCEPLGFARRPSDMASQQAAASVGQMLLVSRYAASFARYGITVGQVLLTAEDMIRRSHYRNALQTFERLAELGVVPVVNENDTVATGEIRFGDNDRLAALVSHLVKADVLFLLSDVDGVYTDHPAKPHARLISEIRSPEDVAGIEASKRSAFGTGGMESKIQAAQIAASAGVHTVVTSAASTANALTGETVGTLFAPTGARVSARALWLKYAASARGRLVLDEGAVAALRTRGASLLAAGVVAVQGEFASGDPVELVDGTNTPVARGLVAFDAVELPALLGCSMRDLATEHQREVVHRDDLVLV